MEDDLSEVYANKKKDYHKISLIIMFSDIKIYY